MEKFFLLARKKFFRMKFLTSMTIDNTCINKY
jgi:hypothetical protein